MPCYSLILALKWARKAMQSDFCSSKSSTLTIGTEKWNSFSYILAILQGDARVGTSLLAKMNALPRGQRKLRAGPGMSGRERE